MKTPNFAYKIR